MSSIPLAEIRSPRLIKIAAYLEAKFRHGHAPSRADIDPVVEIPRLASYLQLMERSPDGRYWVRLAGSVAIDIMGQDLTGRWVDEVAMDTSPDQWSASLGAIFDAKGIICGVSVPPWETRAHLAFEWIALRLSGTPAMAILAFDLTSRTQSP